MQTPDGKGSVSQTEQNFILVLLAILMMVLTYLYELGGWPYVGTGCVAGIIIIGAILGTAENLHTGRKEILEERKRPERDMQIVCPHCQTKGHVKTEPVNRKQGISGGKATAAVLTGGLSLLATGLSEHQKATKATCSNCGSVWYF